VKWKTEIKNQQLRENGKRLLMLMHHSLGFMCARRVKMSYDLREEKMD
jgi:hypothetical protein